MTFRLLFRRSVSQRAGAPQVLDSKAIDDAQDRARGQKAVVGKSTDEMDHDERARLRRTKKARRRKARQAANADSRLVSRLNPGMGNPHEHARALEGLQKARGAGEERALSKDDAKDFSTSARFFRKLQDEASGVAKQVAEGAQRSSDGGWRAPKRKKERDGRAAALML